MAYEQWQQSPQGIESMFNSNVSDGGGTIAATPSLMQLLGQQQHADMLTGQDQQRQLSQNYAMDPLRVRDQDLKNQTAEAQLPGHQAQSMILQSKAAIDQALQPSAIKAGVATNGATATAKHAEEIGNVGTMLQQHAGSIEANPLGADTKGFFDQIGHPELYNPALAELDPTTRARVVRAQGQAYQDAAAKARLQTQKYEMIGDTQRDVAATKAASAEKVAQIHAAAQNALTQAKVEIAKNPKSTDQWIPRLMQMADAAEQAGGAEGAAEATHLRDEAFNLMRYRASIPGTGPAVTTAAKVDPKQFGIETRGSQPAGPQFDNPSTIRRTSSGSVMLGQPPQAASAPARAASGAPRAASGPVMGPPSSHLDYLYDHKDDPQVRKDFDAKYGVGAAEAALRGK